VAVHGGDGCWGWWWLLTSLLSALCGTHGLKLCLGKGIRHSAVDCDKTYRSLVYLKLHVFANGQLNFMSCSEGLLSILPITEAPFLQETKLKKLVQAKVT